MIHNSQAADLNKLNVIHITGTKGKGSTSAFTDSILRQVKPEWKVGERSRAFGSSCLLNHRRAGQGYTLHLISSPSENVSG